MTYRGHVKDGMVVLDQALGLPDGAEVSVRATKRRKSGAKKRTTATPKPKGRKRPRTFHDWLKPFIGCLNDLPPDYSVNLDHYLYGVPKRKP